jgi:hypothetical protein
VIDSASRMKRMLDEPFYASDRDSEAARERELIAAQQAEDLREIMASPAGRRLMWRLLDRAGLYRLSHAGEATHQTAFAEGARNFGLALLDELTAHCHTSYLQMVAETHERQHRRASRRDD